MTLGACLEAAVWAATGSTDLHGLVNDWGANCPPLQQAMVALMDSDTLVPPITMRRSSRCAVVLLGPKRRMQESE